MARIDQIVDRLEKGVYEKKPKKWIKQAVADLRWCAAVIERRQKDDQDRREIGAGLQAEETLRLLEPVLGQLALAKERGGQ